MPRVVVDGAGEHSFPIPDAQIGALIAAAERAPYGKGTETLVHTSVRDCWQIDATHVRLAGRAWPDSFARLMDLVAAGLLDHEYSEGGLSFDTLKNTDAAVARSARGWGARARVQPRGTARGRETTWARGSADYSTG